VAEKLPRFRLVRKGRENGEKGWAPLQGVKGEEGEKEVLRLGSIVTIVGS
jgi:hypothetical protein